RLGLLVSAVLTASACVHAPADRTLKGPLEEPVGTPIDPVPPADESAAYPGDTVPPAAQDAATQSGTLPAVGLTQSQYADLLDRIRAGFDLDDPERSAVTQQLNWYARNPEYLERAFGRAELYLYHIVAELEARNMPLELALLPVVESAFEPYAY